MSIFSVRILINSFIKRPCTHFRSFIKSSCHLNKVTTKYQYQREFTKREKNLYKQLIQRYMATPMNDVEVEKLLEPFRTAVKVQVKKNVFSKIKDHVFHLFRVILSNNSKDNNVNKEDAEFKRAINELKMRKKTLEDQVNTKRDVFE